LVSTLITPAIGVFGLSPTQRSLFAPFRANFTASALISWGCFGYCAASCSGYLITAAGAFAVFPTSGPTLTPFVIMPPAPLFERVRANAAEWQRSGASPVVMRWITEGVRVPFVHGPPAPFRLRSKIPRQPAEHAALVTERDRLLSSGALVPAVSHDFVSSCRLEPKASGGWRLVVDLRHLNSHCPPKPARYETLKSLSSLAVRGDVAFSYDLKDGYHCIAIHPSHQKYFTVDILGSVYSFTVLPFGWSLSPWVFTKVMRVYVTRLRSEGFRVLPYLDDFLHLLSPGSHSLHISQRDRVDNLLQLHGLQRNPTKGQWEPVPVIRHLGLLIDFNRGLFLVPDDRIHAVRHAAKALLSRASSHRRWVPPRDLSSFTGLAVSLHLAVPIARMQLRALYDALCSRVSWSQDVRLNHQAMRDLSWWISFGAPSTNVGRALWPSAASFVLHTDASDGGWGSVLTPAPTTFLSDERTSLAPITSSHSGVLASEHALLAARLPAQASLRLTEVSSSPSSTPASPSGLRPVHLPPGVVLPAHGFWTKTDRQRHINALELEAVQLALVAYDQHVSGRVIDLYTDNQVVAHIINSGTSRSPTLMSALRRLQDFVRAAEIEIFGRAHWLPTADNAAADKLSRLSDPGDWSIHASVFRRLDKWWGPHTIDLFAQVHNAQLPRFITRYPRSAAADCDALQLSWSSEVPWVCPPFGLLFKVISKLLRSRVCATLIAPVWPSAPWWPMLLRMAIDRYDLDTTNDIIPSASCPDDSEPFRNSTWRLAAFRIDSR
jgi:hypothetical protein